MCKHLQRFRMANDTLFSLLNIHLIWMMRMVDSKKEANKSCNDNLFHSRKDKVNFWHGLKYLLNKTSVTYRLVTIYTNARPLASTIIFIKWSNITSSITFFFLTKTTSTYSCKVNLLFFHVYYFLIYLISVTVMFDFHSSR